MLRHRSRMGNVNYKYPMTSAASIHDVCYGQHMRDVLQAIFKLCICAQVAQHCIGAARQDACSNPTSEDREAAGALTQSSSEAQHGRSTASFEAAVWTRLAKRGHATTIAKVMWIELKSPAPSQSSTIGLLQHLLNLVADSQALEKILAAALLEAPNTPQASARVCLLVTDLWSTERNTLSGAHSLPLVHGHEDLASSILHCLCTNS